MTPLWKHQERALQLNEQRDHYALFFEMGTGKSRTVIEIIKEKFKKEGGILPTLILCPAVVVPNWKNEFQLYSGIDTSQLIPLSGPGAKRAADLTVAVRKYDKRLIAITNYEGLLNAALYKEIEKTRFNVLVADESHRLKSMQARRTKLVIALAQAGITYKYLLSGTPVLNSPMDLFSQYLVMDGGESFGKNFYAFRAKYFYDANAYMPAHVKFPEWKLQPKAVEQMNEIVNRSSMRILKSECLDLPPLVRQTVCCEMTPEQSKMYYTMERDFIFYVKEQACVAQLALTKALRLQQIVSGFVKLEDGAEVSLPATPREEALKELLEELTPNHKVIVWATFRHNYAQIRRVCEKISVPYVEVHGEVAEKNRQAAIDSFNHDPAIRVYVGHTGSGGIGVNLTVSDYSIYFSRDFSLEHDLQSEARNHRGGSEVHAKITRIDLVTPNTIDELVLDRLAKKQAMGESLISDIKEKFHG